MDKLHMAGSVIILVTLLNVAFIIGKSSKPKKLGDNMVDLAGITFRDVDPSQSLTYEGKFNVSNSYKTALKVYTFLSSEPDWFRDYVNCSLSLENGTVLQSQESREVNIELAIDMECPSVGDYYVSVRGVKT